MPVGLTDSILDDLSPIYMQFVRCVKFQIMNGSITSGDEMPSRRLLSATLGVNPNTIQKAYKLIEEEELMVSYAGSKSLLQFDQEKVTTIRDELLTQETGQFIQALKRIGIEKDGAHTLIESLWSDDTINTPK